MTNNANSESINITENAEPVNNQGASVDSASVQLGDEVCFNITEEGTVIIGKPVAGVGQAIEADAQQKYVFNMSSDEITSATIEGDDLVVAFNNGSTVTLENYNREFADGGETLNFINGEVVTLASLVIEEPAIEELQEPQVELREALVESDQTQEDIAQELAQTEPAAGEESIAAMLADIEPAAGDAGAGSAGNSGYGFGSSFEAQSVIGVDATGPLGETELQYGIQRPSDDLFIRERAADEPEADPLNPSLEFDNVQVLEDGSVQFLMAVIPDSANGIITITITGIPSTWTVTGDGTFDPSTGTWTHTPPAGTPYTGGPILSPPADSDVDLYDMVITVSETDPDTGNTGTSTGTADVIVDAVADDPAVDGLDDTGLEGETLDIEIPVALTGEEVNAGGIGLDDGSESITNIIISPVDPNVDLNDYTITNVNGPVTLDANGHIVFTDRSELVDLTITPNDPTFVGSIDLTITLNTQENPTDLEFDDTNDTNQATDTITLTWKPVANPPEVEVTPKDANPNGDIENGYVYEDHSVTMNVSGTLDVDGSGNEILTLTVTGIDLSRLEGGEAGFVASNGPDGETWTRVDGGGPDATDASYTITLNNGGANYVGTFTFTPEAQSDLDLIGMEVVASAYEPETDTTANSAPDAFNVYVDAVADDPDVDGLDDSGRQGDTLAIEIPVALTGEEVIAGGIGLDDGSESITNIIISAVDPNVDLNDYTITNVNGTLTLDANGNIVLTDRSELVDLQITPNDPNFIGAIDLKITLNTQENPNDFDFDDTNDTNQATDTITLTWDKNYVPIIADPAKVTVDETDLAGAPRTTSVSDEINVNFGTDYTGASINANGQFDLFGATSNGVAITVSFDASTNTYTGTADGRDVFTLVIDQANVDSNGAASSAYTFTLLDTIDHPDVNDPNDALDFTFGFTATDSDGDTADGSITVTVLDDGPIARDDFNHYTVTDTNLSTDGNVITGENGGPNAADTLSQDAVNTVTEVNGVAIAATGTTTVNGNYGVLEIAADGSYTYTLDAGFVNISGGRSTLDPNSGDVAGVASSITKNGISITGYDVDGTPSDLRWLDTAYGDGIGVLGAYDNKVYPYGESLEIGFEAAKSVKIYIGELGGNDQVGKGIEYVIKFADGSSVSGEYGFVKSEIVNGVTSFTLNSADYGDKLIESVTISSTNEGQYRGASFLLNDVQVTYADIDCLRENFQYTLNDGDGDTSVALLEICADIPANDVPMNLRTEILKVDETDFNTGVIGQDSASGTVTADFGNDGPGTFEIGNPANVTFTGAKDGTLTSNGVAIVIAAVGNAYVGTANGQTIFTLNLNENTGEYEFTLLGQMDHADASDPNDIIELQFGVSAVDNDGDSLDGTITVKVYDDGPIARDDFNHFTATKDDLSTNGNVITGENGGPNAADTLSQDAVNTVTHVDGIAIAATGTTTIIGQYGVLEIAADGSYTYTLDADAENMAAIAFDEPEDFPDLAERQALDNDDLERLGIYNGALDASSVLNGSVTFVSEGASYNNSFGYYTVAADGTLQAATIAVENANNITNANIATLDADAGESLAFFIIAKGFDTNNGYNGIDLDTGSLAFVYKHGTSEARAANIADNGGDISLVYTSAGGAETVLQGAVYHTTERGSANNLNADGTVRVVSGLADGDANTLRIGFEDLPGLGDRDYNDFVFDVQLNSNCLIENFEYTLTDADGDTSLATLQICADLPANDTPINLRTETLKVDETDFNTGVIGQDSASGTVTADFGNDGPGTYEVGNAANVTFAGAKDGTLTSNGVAIQITTEGNSYVGKAGSETIFTLVLNENTGEYEFTLLGQMDHADASDPNDVIDLTFDVIAKDADGDTLGGKINVKVYDDGPVAYDDINTFQVEQANKDFNIVMILDVSGSMAGNQLALLKSSVANLLQDYNDYNGGAVKVHIVPFATSAMAAGTFTVTSDAELNAAINFVNGLSANGWTNYEAPMQSAIDWLQGGSSNAPIVGAETYTYFVSDGEPNRYVDKYGNTASGSAQLVMDEISGNTPTDNVSEIDLLHSLSTEVVGVGIGVNSATLALLGQIDSDGSALDVKDAGDLYASLSAINPVKGSADGNVITGENGGAGAADILSADAYTLVTDVNGHAVNPGSETVVEGIYGFLTINANGDYSYTLKPDIIVSNTTTLNLNPNPSDVAGEASSITKNGITITGRHHNGSLSDLRWEDKGDGNGIGVLGAYDNKVYPYGESLEITFDAANSVEISIGDLGKNDKIGKGIDYVVHFADGSYEAGEYGFVQSEIVNGVTSFTLSSSDYGDKLITGVVIESTDAGDYKGSSFLLNDVAVNYYEPVDIVDTFTYTITDGDGDTSTANLTLYGNQWGTTDGDDVIYGNDGDNYLYGGAGDDVIYGGAGDDILVGGAGDDTLTGGAGADTFVFTNNGGTNVITDFDASEGDMLDISDVLSGFDALNDSLEDFVFTVSNGSDTEVYVDTSGSGNQAAATLIVTLEGVDMTLANLDQNGSGSIIV